MSEPVDREQAKQDAEAVIDEFAFDVPGPAIRTAHACLALLAELKEADRNGKALEEQEFTTRGRALAAEAKLRRAEARLAKVPALVDALRSKEVVNPTYAGTKALADWDRE